MNKLGLTIFRISILLTIPIIAHGQQLGGSVIYFLAVKGEISKEDSVIVYQNEEKLRVTISGEHHDLFKFLTTNAGTCEDKSCTTIKISFEPSEEDEGYFQAMLIIKDNAGKLIAERELRALSLAGLEGRNEPAISELFQFLDIKTDPGWTALANDIEPQKHGDEIDKCLFRKAGDQPIKIIPLARFSPPFRLPFGIYLNAAEGPELHQTGILSDSRNFHEHQTLFPKVVAEDNRFDPGNDPFGLYVVSPTHHTYSEDHWNQLYYPDRTAHAVRVYPLKDKNGNAVPNNYLVCFEEASNGDYQDYIFLVENVEPVFISTR